MKIATSTEYIFRNLTTFCSSVLETTLSDPARAKRLNALGELAIGVEHFVRGYEELDDSRFDTDDEILNWTFAECATDLTSAIWLLASGFYKASASSLRNALDIATTALYFQVRENAHTGTGWNKFYTEWDRGDRQTPNWGEMKTVLTVQPTVASFAAVSGANLVEEAHKFFHHLCGHTHTAAFDSRGHAVTAINLTGTAPAFEPDAFKRGCDLAQETMSTIVMLWQVTFPEIADTDPLAGLGPSVVSALFPAPHGPTLLVHR
jgi:hypothetical protein